MAAGVRLAILVIRRAVSCGDSVDANLNHYGLLRSFGRGAAGPDARHGVLE